jgi:hypothetical protein
MLHLHLGQEPPGQPLSLAAQCPSFAAHFLLKEGRLSPL